MRLTTKLLVSFVGLLLLPQLLSGCASDVEPSPYASGDNDGRGHFKVGKPYEIEGTTYTPQEDYSYDETGIASWYGPGFHGRYTANGEVYDSTQLTAAHRTLPMPSLVRVTNLDNGKSIVVRVNDRGPFARSRIMDMSSRAAELLDFKRQGTAKVRVQILAEESRAIADAARAKGSYDPGSLAASPQIVAAAAAQNVDLSPTGSSPVAATSAAVEQESLAPLPGAPAVQMATAGQTIDVPVVAEVPPPSLTIGHVPTPQQIQKLEVKETSNRYLPEPKVEQTVPVVGTKIFVQAGAFASLENAHKLQQSLSRYGTTSLSPADVGGQSFQRVRIGPFNNVGDADAVLNKVISGGEKNARVVVDR